MKPPADAAYGAIGWALAFAALPLVVLMPAHYAREHAVPLGTLGALLLAVRAIDAAWDPLAGRWADRALQHSATAAWWLLAGAAAALWVGFAAVFFPPSGWSGTGLLAWCAGALLLTMAAYSLGTIVHQAWAARTGGGDDDQARRAAWREGAALAGVMAASTVPLVAGFGWTAALLALGLAVGLWALRRGPQPLALPASHAHVPDPHRTRAAGALWQPWRLGAFRRLMLAFVANGIANAVPATLLVFYVTDRLQAPQWTPWLLATYFACGMLSLPWWVSRVPSWGLERTWSLGMTAAVAAFSGAAWLGPGDVAWFALVCAVSGLTLGADLAVPPALLARVMATSQASSEATPGISSAAAGEGVAFGWWTGANKLNLALAAGLALPLLQAVGYSPGTRDPKALTALMLAYAVLPCVLKLLALAVLCRRRPSTAPVRTMPWNA